MTKKITLYDIKSEFYRIGKTDQETFNKERSLHIPRSRVVLQRLQYKSWKQLLLACGLQDGIITEEWKKRFSNEKKEKIEEEYIGFSEIRRLTGITTGALYSKLKAGHIPKPDKIGPSGRLWKRKTVLDNINAFKAKVPHPNKISKEELLTRVKKFLEISDDTRQHAFVKSEFGVSRDIINRYYNSWDDLLKVVGREKKHQIKFFDYNPKANKKQKIDELTKVAVGIIRKHNINSAEDYCKLVVERDTKIISGPTPTTLWKWDLSFEYLKDLANKEDTLGE